MADCTLSCRLRWLPSPWVGYEVNAVFGHFVIATTADWYRPVSAAVSAIPDTAGISPIPMPSTGIGLGLVYTVLKVLLLAFGQLMPKSIFRMST